MPHLTRRAFAAVAAAGIAAAQQQPAGSPNPNTSLQPQRRQGTLDPVPPFDGPIEFSSKSKSAPRASDAFSSGVEFAHHTT